MLSCYRHPMPLVQIKDVPDETHRRLKARAALAGRSLSDYLREQLEQIAAQPTLDELLARLQTREPVAGEPVAGALRAERAAR
jgi:plasmid stability protein